MNTKPKQINNRQPAFFLVAFVLVLSTLAFGKNAISLLTELTTIERAAANPLSALMLIIATISLLLIALRWMLHLILLMIPSRPAPEFSNEIPVTAVIPAYNEEKGICRTIESLAAQDYENLEIIVIDDGSKDKTLQLARDCAAELNQDIRVLTQKNGGKSTALNHGFREGTGSLFLTVDADREVASDAVSRMVRWFSDPTVDAVAGQVKVSNRDSAITKLQALEYLIGNTVYRRAQSLFGSVLLAPGPIAMYRVASLKEISDNTRRPGIFLNDTFAEDFEITVAMLVKDKRVVFDPDAIAYTIAPNTLTALVSQRYRWIRGNMQVCKKFLRVINTEQCPGRMRTLFWMSPTFLFELALLPIIVLFSISGLLTSSIAGYELPQLEWLLVVPLLTLCIGVISVYVQRDKVSSLVVVPVYDVVYGMILTVVWMIAAIDEARSSKMNW